MSAVSNTERRSSSKSAHFVLVLTVGVAFAGTNSPALGIVAFSTGAADVKTTTEDKLALFATSPLAVFTRSEIAATSSRS